MQPVYVVTDIEVDGPDPGQHSMRSFASVAIDDLGREVDAFEAVLQQLDGATPDPRTMDWFKSQPEAFAAITKDPKPVKEVITHYVDWVRSLPGDPIFVAHPVAFDGAWLDLYLRKFAGTRLVKGPFDGERLFYAGGLCLRSFAAGRLGWPLWKCAPENYPVHWLGGIKHTHLAIDDARGYANLLVTLMKLQAGSPAS